MKTYICSNPQSLGEKAATLAEQKLNNAISERGYARLILSTGASQFETISELVNKNVDWSNVEVFHLDEYIDIDINHPASFRRYILDRFASKVNLKALHMVNGQGDITRNIKMLTKEIRKSPIDVAFIGIGENAHIAFNDPPADFDCTEAFIIVNLDEKCRRQQLREGWFDTLDEVPKKAISMTVKEIIKCHTIISSVPHSVKAEAIKKTYENEITSQVPATILKKHKDWHLFLDEESAVFVKDYLK